MAVKLCVEPKTPPMPWEQFCKEKPALSIAIDGYVSGAPNEDPKKHLLSLNHHEQVKRLNTRATCAQALFFVRQGLYSYFRINEEATAQVYTNDCDHDVDLTWTILHNPELVLESHNPSLNRLVKLVDELDTTSGLCYIDVSLPILQHHAWIFDPYMQFRLSGNIDKRDPKEFAEIIYAVEARILRHLDGTGESIPVNTDYIYLGGRNDWAMIKEIGAQARGAAFKNGIRALITVRERVDGNYNYSFCKALPFVHFDIPLILSTLNALEGLTDKPDRHGGGDFTGGTSRNLGCAIPPKELERIINSLHQ